MSIEETDIEWVADGEKANAEVLNRPGKELLDEINDALAKKVNSTGNETIKGIKTFESFPVTPSNAPTNNYQTANKKYVDDGLAKKVNSTGNETIKGIKTFESFPVTPSTAPTSNYQTANKKYVDDTKVGLTGNETIKGIKTFESFPVTPSAAPTNNYQTANKKYVDDTVNAIEDTQPSIAAICTTNGTTNNTVQMTNIVTTLGLEKGDVIRIQYSIYDKLHTVESITNNNLIRVNYEHAGNRGDGSLKLVSQSSITMTITRIAKWYNAPTGVGQAWLSMTGSRSSGSAYTNTTGRPIMVNVEANRDTWHTDSVLTVGGSVVARASHGDAKRTGMLPAIVPSGAEYKVTGDGGFQGWWELR